MDRRNVSALVENMPVAVGLPIGLILSDGLTPVLALAVPSAVLRSELDVFLRRHGFVARGQTARALASRARWRAEMDGRVVFSFHADHDSARLEIPGGPEMQAWAAWAFSSGGTVGVMVLPEMDEPTAADVGLRVSSGGGEYWLLSAGYSL